MSIITDFVNTVKNLVFNPAKQGTEQKVSAVKPPKKQENKPNNKPNKNGKGKKVGIQNNNQLLQKLETANNGLDKNQSCLTDKKNQKDVIEAVINVLKTVAKDIYPSDSLKDGFWTALAGIRIRCYLKNTEIDELLKNICEKQKLNVQRGSNKEAQTACQGWLVVESNIPSNNNSAQSSGSQNALSSSNKNNDEVSDQSNNKKTEEDKMKATFDISVLTEIKKSLESVKTDLTVIKSSTTRNLENDISSLKTSVKIIENNTSSVRSLPAKYDIDMISSKVTSAEKSVEQQAKDLAEKTKNFHENIKGSIQEGINKIDQKLIKFTDVVIDDLKTPVDEINKKLSQPLIQDLEMLPATLTKQTEELKLINKKLDNLNSKQQADLHIPVEEKAIVDLHKYMVDGLEHLAYISQKYIQEKADLEQAKVDAKNHAEKLNQAKQNGIAEGKKQAQIKIAKQLAVQFESSFLTVQSMFGEIITEKFAKDEVIEINANNQNDFARFIKGELSFDKFKVLSPAISVDGTVVIHAKLEKIVETQKAETVATQNNQDN